MLERLFQSNDDVREKFLARSDDSLRNISEAFTQTCAATNSCSPIRFTIVTLLPVHGKRLIPVSSFNFQYGSQAKKHS
jgi:hypothetical protein